MQWDDTFQIISAALFSIVGAGVIILALSSWLGKVWAKRILASETHQLNTELEQTKTQLNAELESTKSQLDYIKKTTLKFQNDKILTYRLVIDIVSKILADFDAVELDIISNEKAMNNFHSYNQQRIQAYGYLAMLAPQAIMDAQDNLIDHLIKISNRSTAYCWEEVRDLSLQLLNEIRIDIGIDKTPISYNGDL